MLMFMVLECSRRQCPHLDQPLFHVPLTVLEDVKLY